MADNDPFRRYIDAGAALTQLTMARAEELVQEFMKNGEFQRKEAQAKVEACSSGTQEHRGPPVDRPCRGIRSAVLVGYRKPGRTGPPSRYGDQEAGSFVDSGQGDGGEEVCGQEGAGQEDSGQEDGKKTAAKKTHGQNTAAKKTAAKKTAAKKTAAKKTAAKKIAPGSAD